MPQVQGILDFSFDDNNSENYQRLNTLIDRMEPIKLKSFVPKPQDVDYKRGWISRYFIAKSWFPSSMVEVTVDTYDNDFSKLNKGAYSRTQVDWHISGNIKDYVMDGGQTGGVITKNMREINESKKNVPAIIILKNNLLQFYKSDNLYTNGGEYTLQQGGSGLSYIGLYHIAAGIGPMVGPYHTGNAHATLYPMDGSDPATIGNSMGGIL